MAYAITTTSQALNIKYLTNANYQSRLRCAQSISSLPHSAIIMLSHKGFNIIITTFGQSVIRGDLIFIPNENGSLIE